MPSTTRRLLAGFGFLGVVGQALSGCGTFAFYEDTKVAVSISVDPSAPDPVEITAAFKEAVYALAPIKRRTTEENKAIIETGDILADFDVRYGANANATPGAPRARDILYAVITHGLATGDAALFRQGAADGVVPGEAIEHIRTAGIEATRSLERAIALKATEATAAGVDGTLSAKLGEAARAAQGALTTFGTRLTEIRHCDANDALSARIVILRAEILAAPDEPTRRSKVAELEAQAGIARYKVIADGKALLRQLQGGLAKAAETIHGMKIRAGSAPDTAALDAVPSELGRLIPAAPHSCRT